MHILKHYSKSLVSLGYYHIIMSTHAVLRSADKVINELLIEAKGPLQVNAEYIPDQLTH